LTNNDINKRLNASFDDFVFPQRLSVALEDWQNALVITCSACGWPVRMLYAGGAMGPRLATSFYLQRPSLPGLSEMGGGGNAGASTLGAHRPSTGAMRGVAAGAAAKKTCVPS